MEIHLRELLDRQIAFIQIPDTKLQNLIWFPLNDFIELFGNISMKNIKFVWQSQ